MKKLTTIILLFLCISGFSQVYKGSGGVYAYPEFRSTYLDGQAYRFDAASSQGLYDDDGTDYQIKDWGAGTMCAWAKTSSADLMIIISKGLLIGDIGRWQIGCNTGGCGFVLQHQTGVILELKQGTADGLWHHYVLTLDTTGYFKGYIDGVIYDSVDISSYDWSTENTNRFAVGFAGGIGDGGTRYFTGDIKDARIFKRQITAAEVTKIYEGKAIGDEYRWWLFEVDRCYDVSGNDNGLIKQNFNANSYITGDWLNPMNLYGFSPADSIPFDASTIDNFGTAKENVAGEILLRKPIKQ